MTLQERIRLTSAACSGVKSRLADDEADEDDDADGFDVDAAAAAVPAPAAEVPLPLPADLEGELARPGFGLDEPSLFNASSSASNDRATLELCIALLFLQNRIAPSTSPSASFCEVVGQ